MPGKGFSSPIVCDDTVYLTTSYKTDKNNLFIPLISNLILVLSYLILIVLTIFVNGQIRSMLKVRNYLSLLAFSSLVIILLLLVLFSENVFDYERCDSRKWVGGSLLLVISLFSISLLNFKKAVRLKRIVGVVILLFIAFFFIFMPEVSKNHLFRDGWMSINPRFLYILNLFYGIAALLVIINWLPFRKSAYLNNEISLNKGASLKTKLTLFWFIVILIAAIVVSMFAWLITTNAYLSYRFGSPMIKPIISWSTISLRGFTWILLIIILSLKPRYHFSSKRLINSLSYLIISVGLMSFFYTNYLFVRQQHCRAIVSLNSESGGINWICEGLYGSLGSLNQNSPASPTPVTNGKYVYAYFGSSGLFCCDLKGKKVWERKDLPFQSYYGAGTSPVIYDDKIILFSDSPKSSYLSVIDASNGREIWRKNLNASQFPCGSSRTPIVKRIGDQDLIFIWNWNSLITFDLNDGKVKSRKTVSQEMVDIVAGLISDSSKLYLAAPNSCISIDYSGLNGFKVEWETKVKGPNIPSPILVNDLVYILNDRGFISCIESEDGRLLWRERLSGRAYFSSPISDGKRIYFTDKLGHTTVIKASSKFEIIAENKLNVKLYASIVPYRNKLFIRSYNDLYCISELSK
jgi:outer membrane protein assembly factor BamB